jgi:(1->4)-alpha-D-glucan 1-alpha-D-glucosylmutase
LFSEEQTKVKQTPEIPLATYRLQFNAAFTFRDATAIIPYLKDLGISHCYASPYLRARPGSMHGYDIIDHNSLNPEIGTAEDYEHFVDELHSHGMGQILDIVPNHMGVMGSDNTWWLDVLENGEASEYADFFDIDWEPIKEELHGKVLLPVLADQYGNVLDSGDLKLAFDADRGEFSVFYFEHRFPIDPREYPRILGMAASQEGDGEPQDHDLVELRSIATAFGHLPARHGLSPQQRSERNREKEVQKRRLAALCRRSHRVHDLLQENVQLINGRKGAPRSFDALHELIKAQAYRLAYWRVAGDDINYRRFFDINDLAALCMENRTVFERTHQFILQLIATGKLNGLRVDHPDGLFNPREYLGQLRTAIRAKIEDSGVESKLPYVVVEKILTGDERLRKDWPVEGTTGYEFSNLLNGLFIDSASAQKMERIYRTFTGRVIEFTNLVYKCKKLILKTKLASELNVLANLLNRIALSDRHTCDFTLHSLRSALADIIACFPVYRTYIADGNISSEDRAYIEQAVTRALDKTDAADVTVFAFVRRCLLMETNSPEPSLYMRRIMRFAVKFQQVTAAVMAKGLEDTAFYRYYRLASLNEVGGNPARFGITVDDFHQSNRHRLEAWPHSMLSSSTHDSKRSEDVRARINVLSEVPGQWRLALRRWKALNRQKKRILNGVAAPVRNDEYLLYQTLVGTWPTELPDGRRWACYVQRIRQYMIKAAREAKEHTSWVNTRVEYEEALSAFVCSLLERSSNNLFLSDFAEFHALIARAGSLNSLSQTLLKLIAPGVPDIYQGTELIYLSLVDPDNRRPVDYEQRKRMLEEVQDKCPQQLRPMFTGAFTEADASLLKIYLIWKVLSLRKRETALFQQGSYLPLSVAGERAEHVCAIERRLEDRSAVVLAPRLWAKVLANSAETVYDEEIWGDAYVSVPEAAAPCYHNILTGECVTVDTVDSERTLPVRSILRNFPVAVLVNEPCANHSRHKSSV